jgi:ABC-2 type transport system ATP-binding protein
VIVGRGKVIADTSVAELVTAASGNRVTLRTAALSEAMAALERAGAAAIASGPDTVTISGLSAQGVVTVLGTNGVQFSEVSAHRATLEQAYMEITRDAVEFRAEPTAEVAR